MSPSPSRISLPGIESLTPPMKSLTPPDISFSINEAGSSARAETSQTSLDSDAMLVDSPISTRDRSDLRDRSLWAYGSPVDMHSLVKKEDSPSASSNRTGLIPSISIRRRRAKRTQDERIAYLRDDPYVAEFEAYRVLCASCHKWIRLRPNSTYCSIPWDAHRKSCLARRVPKISSSLDERNVTLARDPDIVKFDSERVLCRMCDSWIDISPNNHIRAVQTWVHHRNLCHARSLGRIRATGTPSIQATSLASQISPRPSSSSLSVATSSPNPRDPIILPPLNEKLLAKNASSNSWANVQQRFANTVPEHIKIRCRSDSDGAVSNGLNRQDDDTRVFCKPCQTYVKLRQDGPACMHIQLRSQERRFRSSEEAIRKVSDLVEKTSTRSDCTDSDHEATLRNCPRLRDPSRSPGARIGDTTTRRSSVCEQVDRRTLQSLNEAPARQGRSKNSVRSRCSGPYDLSSSHGRASFVFVSIHQLFSTSYRRSDILEISALLTYVNAALPPDRYEDFDTPELVRIVDAMHLRGRIILEGSSIRLPSDSPDC